MLVTKQLTVAIDFHSMDKKYHGSQWLPSTLFKISSWVNYYLFNSHFSIQKLISSHNEICILSCVHMFAYLNVIGPFDFASIDSSFWHIIINIYILSLSFFFYLYLVVLTKASITIAHT